MLPIVVMTCPKYSHLLTGFMERYKNYWNDPNIIVDVAKEGEAWSDQLLRICHSLESPYFIRLCEDFWMYQPIKQDLLAEGISLKDKIDRVSLQCVSEGYQDCVLPGDSGWKQLDPKAAEYLGSMEASIYRTQFLLDHVKSGQHIWETEVQLSQDTKGFARVFVHDTRIVSYNDATRRGESRVEGLANI